MQAYPLGSVMDWGPLHKWLKYKDLDQLLEPLESPRIIRGGIREPCSYRGFRGSASYVISLLAILRGWTEKVMENRIICTFSSYMCFFSFLMILKIGNCVYVQQGKKKKSFYIILLPWLVIIKVLEYKYSHANNLSKTVPHWPLDTHLFIIFYLQRLIF